MSCELFCCEIPKLLEMFVEDSNSIHLNHFFSILDLPSPLDNFLAGYFEKVLEMLFRRMTVQTMSYLNEGGIQLLNKFLKHIDNYSIMQIVQRVLLPHIPFSAEIVDFDSMSVEQRLSYQCSWAYSDNICQLLVDKMIDVSEKSSIDVSVHISDLLITVLTLSPSSASFIHLLCDPACTSKLLSNGFKDNTEMFSLYDLPTHASNISISCLSVVESLVSRLCEALQPYEVQTNGIEKELSPDESNALLQIIAKCVDSIIENFIPYVTILGKQLEKYVIDEVPSENGDGYVCGVAVTQSNTRIRRLGPRGLRLVRIIEVIVRLSNQQLNMLLHENKVFEYCIKLFNLYPMNSLLHLAVQRIIIVLVENQETPEE
jgi:hypothetical protein